MSEIVYTRCNLCHGTLVVPENMAPCTGDLRCPCRFSQFPGWAATGLTLGQQERAVRGEVLAKELLVAVEDLLVLHDFAMSSYDNAVQAQASGRLGKIDARLRELVAKAKGKT